MYRHNPLTLTDIAIPRSSSEARAQCSDLRRRGRRSENRPSEETRTSRHAAASHEANADAYGNRRRGDSGICAALSDGTSPAAHHLRRLVICLLASRNRQRLDARRWKIRLRPDAVSGHPHHARGNGVGTQARLADRSGFAPAARQLPVTLAARHGRLALALCPSNLRHDRISMGTSGSRPSPARGSRRIMGERVRWRSARAFECALSSSPPGKAGGGMKTLHRRRLVVRRRGRHLRTGRCGQRR